MSQVAAPRGNFMLDSAEGMGKADDGEKFSLLK